MVIAGAARAALRGAKAVGKVAVKGAKVTGKVASRGAQLAGRAHGALRDTRTYAVGGAAMGAVAGAGAAVASKTLGSAKDYGFALFIMGLFTFFTDFIQSDYLSIFVGTIFMFYAAILLFDKKGVVTVTLFWTWFVFFGGTTDITTLQVLIVPMLLIGLVVHGLVNKFSNKGTFLQGAGGEIVYGLIPIAIFFLDLGIIEFLVEAYGVTFTPVLQNIVLFTPWWALLGIFTTKKHSGLITIAKILALVYIFSMLTVGVAPEVIDNYQNRLDSADISGASADLKSTLPKKENPFVSQMACVFGGGYTDIPGCVKKRQQDSEDKAVCAEKYEVNIDPQGYNDCLEEQRQARLKPQQRAAGVVDTTIKEPTTAKLLIDRKTLPDIYHPQFGFPFEIEIANPRNQLITLDFSCSFAGKSGREDVAGEVRIEGGSEIVFSDPTFINSFLCYPNSSLEGRYTFQVNVTLQNLKTPSRLQRAFIGNKEPEEKERLRVEEISKAIPIDKSQSPADFARINFWVGHGQNEVIVEKKPYRPVHLSSVIQNTGRGRITAVHSYIIKMPEFQILSPQPPGAKFGCLQGSSTDFPFKKKEVRLAFCQVDLPAELAEVDDWTPKEFEAELIYDYQIQAKTDVTLIKQEDLLG
jgi:hypothetical protein